MRMASRVPAQIIGCLPFLGILACGTGDGTQATQSGGLDIGAETGETDTGPCWTEARTGYPEMEFIWSEGERAVAYGNGAFLLREDGTWTLYEDPAWVEQLGSSTVTLVGGDPGTAWLRVGFSVYFWDGVSLQSTLLDVAQTSLARDPSGNVYMSGMSECYSGCPAQLWRLDSLAENWAELDAPPFTDPRDLWAGDDELWLSSTDGRFAQRSGGVWTVEQIDPTFEGGVIDVGPEGTLWALDTRTEPMRLARRDPLGSWSIIDTPLVSSLPNTSLVAANGYAYLFDRTLGSNDPPQVWITDGVGEPSVVTQFEDTMVMMAGDPERAVVLGPEPSAIALELAANPAIDPTPTRSLEVAYESISAHGGSAATLDAVFELSLRSLQRWDGEAWTAFGELLDADSDARFVNFWAESSSSVWIVGDGPGEQRDGEIWRWTKSGLEVIDAGLPDDVTFTHIWGSSGDRIVALGINTKSLGKRKTIVWTYDGANWAERVGLAEAWPGPVGLGGSADHVWVLDRAGVVHVFDGVAWTELPALAELTHTADFADLGGGEFLLSYTYEIGVDFNASVELALALAGWAGVDRCRRALAVAAGIRRARARPRWRGLGARCRSSDALLFRRRSLDDGRAACRVRGGDHRLTRGSPAS